MMRVLDRFGVALVCCAPTKRKEACDALESGGLRIAAVISWDKGAPGISHRVRYSHEDLIIAHQSGAGDPFDQREPLISPIRVPRVQYTEHPNEKPVALYRKLIAWATNGEGQLILDPFAGIASCGVAAIAQKCDYIGVECDERWWPIGERRLAEARNYPHPDIEQDSLFGDVA
jgi:DNA modification methylase